MVGFSETVTFTTFVLNTLGLVYIEFGVKEGLDLPLYYGVHRCYGGFLVNYTYFYSIYDIHCYKCIEMRWQVDR
jgi:hypothetical protein